jgi:MSHA biogenesis protein MshO
MISNKSSHAGFTLVEMIIVMVITGIIGGMVAIFLKSPIQQYMDVARRAELTDIADTAFQRVLRDIRTAVPNSVRLPTAAGSLYIEYLPTKMGGRYRANATTGVGACGATGNELTFGAADTCFEVIGPAVSAVANDYLVVGSTQSSGSLPYDQTITGVLRKITAVGLAGIVQSISITATALDASAELDSQRFQIVDGTTQAVTYSCEGVGKDTAGNGTGQLKRYSGYGFAGATIPSTAPVLANNISDCSFVYDVVNQRDGLVALTLQFSKDGETVSLYEEIHVNNAP